MADLSSLPDLAIVLVLLGPVVVAALALAYWPRRRPPAARPETYRGTPVEWPRAPLRLHPRFERLHR